MDKIKRDEWLKALNQLEESNPEGFSCRDLMRERKIKRARAQEILRCLWDEDEIFHVGPREIVAIDGKRALQPVYQLTEQAKKKLQAKKKRTKKKRGKK